MMSQNNNLVEVVGLKKYFFRRDLFLRKSVEKAIKAVDGVNLEVSEGESLGLVGESGCGKTTTGLLLVRLYEPTEGTIYFEGGDISHLKGDMLKRYRKKIQMIFQNPYESLSPTKTIYNIVNEPLYVNKIGNKEERRERVAETLYSVGLKTPEDYFDKHPHQLSGGERQRVTIAKCLVLKPKFIVADEPVSMLDVSIRASVLNVLKDLVNKMSLSMLYISHDISTVGYLCSRVLVMYLGRIIEVGPIQDIIRNPHHPYVKALISAVPRPDPLYRDYDVKIKGAVPDAINIPSGCRFRPRCPKAVDICQKQEPQLIKSGRNHFVACHLHA